MRTIALALMAAAVLAAGPLAEARSRKTRGGDGVSAAIQGQIQQAKALMLEGYRKKAIDLLDGARAMAKTKADLKALASKRGLFEEQFLTSDSFQDFQEAKGMAEARRWDDCLRSLDAIGDKDRDNLLVMRLRGVADMGLKQLDNAAKSYNAVLTIAPEDLSARFGLVEIAALQKNSAGGLSLLEHIEPESSNDIEHYAILKAWLLEQADRAPEAAELLRDDQEKHLDHVDVLYELGMLYTRIGGHDWQARKMLSLFVTRCKRMKDAELKEHGYDAKLTQAQSQLSQIDSRLGV